MKPYLIYGFLLLAIIANFFDSFLSITLAIIFAALHVGSKIEGRKDDK